jgi:hypothetical protein
MQFRAFLLHLRLLTGYQFCVSVIKKVHSTDDYRRNKKNGLIFRLVDLFLGLDFALEVTKLNDEGLDLYLDLFCQSAFRKNSKFCALFH